MDSDYFKPSGVGQYTWVNNPGEAEIEQMKTAIYEGGAVTFGIYAASIFMGYSGGIYQECHGYSANHAVQSMGYGTDYLLCKNSWGEGWGDRGFFKIAHCVVTDFTVPGDVAVEEYPLPIPTATLTTSTTTPPPVESVYPCTADEEDCVSSPNYPADYPTDQTCTISYKIGEIVVIDFDTEQSYDWMMVNGKKYSGTSGPVGVEPVENIVWSSDYGQAAKGWKICPKASSRRRRADDIK